MPFKKGEVQHPNAAKQHWKKGESGNPEVIKENVKDVSTEDLQARVFQLVSNEK